MYENTNLSELMEKPNMNQISEIWVSIMAYAKKLEEESGFDRETVIEGLLKVTIDLAYKRTDQNAFRSSSAIKKSLFFVSEEAKKEYEKFCEVEA